MPMKVAAALAVLLVGVRARSEERRCPPMADLATLVRCAQVSSDSVVRARSGLAAAQARRDDAGRFLPTNPTLEVGVGRRKAESGETGLDRSVELAQTLEIGGQRSARIAAADAELRAASVAAEVASRDLATDVLAAAVEVVRARSVLALVGEQLGAAERLTKVSGARSQKGVAAPLETELTQAAAIQAMREHRGAAQALAAAEADLAAAVGEDVRLADAADLPRTELTSRELPELERAAQERPQIVAARADAAVAHARIELLRRERIPDVTIAAGYRHEEFSDAIGARISVPLPVVRRHGPEIAMQEALAAQAESAARQVSLRALLAVRAAWASWQRARGAVATISPDLESRLRQDVTALQDAYQRGTMPLTQILAALREAQGARRTLLETRADVVRAALELNRAAGLPSCPTGGCP